jgi:hypothetical protein
MRSTHEEMERRLLRRLRLHARPRMAHAAAAPARRARTHAAARHMPVDHVQVGTAPHAC